MALEDEPRDASRLAVALLRDQGLQVEMITGDARQVADAVARDLGIEEVFAEVLPEDKDLKVRDLQVVGRRVAMVGDGVNDAPALARADVGIAIGAGTDVAIEAAGIVLASDDPRGVLSVLRLSRAGYRKMLQNLVWAVGYNAVALPIAAGVCSADRIDDPSRPGRDPHERLDRGRGPQRPVAAPPRSAAAWSGRAIGDETGTSHLIDER
jgi:P-type Cu2+ transporter